MYFAVLFTSIAFGLAGMATPAQGADDLPRGPVSLLAAPQEGNVIVVKSYGRVPVDHVLPVALARPALPEREPTGWLATTGDGTDLSPELAPDLSVEAVQRLLRQLGFYAGAEDGIAGTMTRSAIAAYQKARDIPETGVSDAAFIAQLRAEMRADRPEPGGAVTVAMQITPPALRQDGDTTPVALPVALRADPPESPALEQRMGGGTAPLLYDRADGRGAAVAPAPEYTLESAVWELFSITRRIAGHITLEVSEAFFGKPAPITE